MVSTGAYYPNIITNSNARSPHWTNLDGIENAEIPPAATEGGTAASPYATVSLPASAMSDGAVGTDFGFNIPRNCRVDGITTEILRSGPYAKDIWVSLNIAGSWRANKGKSRQRTDYQQMIDIYGGSNDLWGIPALGPQWINDPNFGFGIVVQNSIATSHPAYLQVLGVNVNYTNPTYSLTSNLPTLAAVGGQISYQVILTCTNSIDQGASIPVEIPIPSGFSLVSATSSEGVYNSTTSTWSPILNSSKKATLNITLQADTAGAQTQVITETEFSTTLSKTCTILSSDPGSINKSEALLSDTKLLANLIDGEIYTISAYNKIVDSGYTGIFDGIKNNRITVINGTEVQGDRVSAQNTVTRVGVTFRYDASEDLILRLYGQYQSVSTVEQSDWRGFQITQGDSLIYEIPLNLFEDPTALLDNTSTTTITLPSSGISNTYEYLLDTIPQQLGPNPFYTGIQLSFDVEDRADSGISVQIKSSTGNDSEIKTKNFDSENTQIIFGDSTDLWGLDNDDISLQDLIIDLIISNISLSSQTFTYSNLELILYWQNDETYGAMGFTLNDTHSRVYNLQLTDVSIPENTKKNIETISLTRLDGELPTNQNIAAKDIDLEFIVWADTIQEAQTRLRLISQWLSNTRNELMIPETNTLIFDHDPTRAYEVILSDIIDVTTKYTTLQCKAKFIIPSGVAFDTVPKSTGAIGSNDGLVKVRPLITVKADGSAAITVTDSVTSQYVTINHTITSDTDIIVDCENRTVTSSDGLTDYTSYVNLNSVWFNFIGAYELTVTGGVLQDVTFTEGY